MNEDEVEKQEHQNHELDLKELEKRAALFKPWLEEDATKKYFEIIKNKVRSLERQRRAVSFTMQNREQVIANMDGKIDMGERMAYMPEGCIRTYDRIKIQKQTQEVGKNG